MMYIVMRQLTRYLRPARSRVATALVVCVTLIAGGELANAATWTPAATSPTTATSVAHGRPARAPALEADASAPAVP